MWKQANILLKNMTILKYCIPKSPTLLKSYKFECVCVCVLFFFSVPLRSIAWIDLWHKFTLTTTELGIASLIPHGVSFQIDFGFCVPKMNQCPFRFGKSPYWRQLWKTLNCSRCSHLLLLFSLIGPRFSCFFCLFAFVIVMVICCCYCRCAQLG